MLSMCSRHISNRGSMGSRKRPISERVPREDLRMWIPWLSVVESRRVWK